MTKSFIATYDQVIAKADGKTNTFQIVLALDSATSKSYVMINYGATNSKPDRTQLGDINYVNNVFFTGGSTKSNVAIPGTFVFHTTNSAAMPTPPASLSYKNTTCMPIVKNQGSCGSCWTFSTIGALEYAYCKKAGKYVQLSEQQLVDCVSKNGGCDGGHVPYAFDYASVGLVPGSTYTYTGVQSTCKFNAANVVARLYGNVYVPGYVSEQALMAVLFGRGPASTAAYVDITFQNYKTGVYTFTPGDGNINHAIIVCGYGTDAVSGPFWIIKNSWGPGWGEQGYMRLSRNKVLWGFTYGSLL